MCYWKHPMCPFLIEYTLNMRRSKVTRCQNVPNSQHTPWLKPGACSYPSTRTLIFSTFLSAWNNRTADKAEQPLPLETYLKRPTQKGYVQVVLARRALCPMPICACRTIRPIGVNTYHKQFLRLAASAFVLACSYYCSSVSRLSRLSLSTQTLSTHRLSTALRGSHFFLPMAEAKNLQIKGCDE